MTIRKDGIPITVSIDGTKTVPIGNEDPIPDENRGNKATSPSEPDVRSDVCANITGDTANPNKCDSEATENVVSHIVSDLLESGETKYRVRWYGYSKDKDTVEP